MGSKNKPEDENSDQQTVLEKELKEAFIRSVENAAESIKDLSILDLFPRELFIFPLVRRPFFPGMIVPINIDKSSRFYEIVKVVSQSKDKYIGLVLTKKETAQIEKISIADLHTMGVLSKVLRIAATESGDVQVALSVERRFKIEKDSSTKKQLKAEVAYFQDQDELVDEQLKAYSINIITTIKELTKLNPLFKEELQLFLGQSDFTEPGKLADFSVALTTSSRNELQRVLEETNVTKRIDKALGLLRKELDLTRLQDSITQKIEATISKNQREFFLKEQLRTVQKELGIIKDEKNCDVEKFLNRLKKKSDVSKETLKVIEEEIDKLNVLDIHSGEYSVCRNYLDWLTILPWGNYSKENFNLAKAETLLHRDHFGLDDVNERILEFISIGKLSGKLQGNIICLVGPPGVGKTSVGKSIAAALKRKFYRFSVGGMRDEAEVKGHRRTYIGAMPGKIVQALKLTRTMNPLIMIDEVDKLGANSYRGDPASTLLEVLDPEQNKEFLDHYLDVPVDLSRVLFVLTANVLDTIPSALRDRMEIIRLSGYLLEEKIEIAKKYLIPKHRKKMGLKVSDISFSTEVLRTIVDRYAREAGVRSFEIHLQKILRKVAKKLVSYGENPSGEKPKKENIVPKTLEDYLGKPLFLTDRFYHNTPIGVSTGLAWTSAGGATLYIEAVSVKSEKVEMKLTGQAGDVMKESAQIAWTYLQSAFQSYFPKASFFELSRVHIHIPEGATPKDGPSAGIAMTTALLSLLAKIPIAEDLGMTGEITLTGKVLPVGGIKEKLMAARRSKLTDVILPQENLRDYDELSDHLKQGVQIHFVNHYDEVVKIAFPSKTPTKKTAKRK